MPRHCYCFIITTTIMITIIIIIVATVIVLFIIVSICFVGAFIQDYTFICIKRTLVSRLYTGCFKGILPYVG